MRTEMRILARFFACFAKQNRQSGKNKPGAAALEHLKWRFLFVLEPFFNGAAEFGIGCWNSENGEFLLWCALDKKTRAFPTSTCSRKAQVNGLPCLALDRTTTAAVAATAGTATTGTATTGAGVADAAVVTTRHRDDGMDCSGKRLLG